MKLLEKKIISTIILILIVNCILIESKVKFKKYSVQKLKTKMKTFTNVKVMKTAYDELRTMDIITFIVAFGTQMPFVDFIFQTVEKVLKLAEDFEQCGNFKSEYEKNLKEIYDATVIEVEKAKRLMSDFEDELIARSKNIIEPKYNEFITIDDDDVKDFKRMTPRRKCKTLKAFKKKEYEKWAKKYVVNQTFIDEYVKNFNSFRITSNDVWNPSLCILGSCDGKIWYKELLMSLGVNSQNKLEQYWYGDAYETRKDRINDEVDKAMDYALEIGEKYKEIKSIGCKKFPDNDKSDDLLKAATPGFIAKAKAAIYVIPNMLHCVNIAATSYSVIKTAKELIDKFNGTVIATGMLGKVLLHISTFLADMFGLFFIKAIKIVYWVIKAMYYVYEAFKEMDKIGEYDIYDQKLYNHQKRLISKNWGKAAGAGVRIVLVTLSVGKK